MTPEFSLKTIVLPALEEVLERPVAFAEDCVGPAAEAAVKALKDGQILLLENVRFHPEEEKNDPAFAKALAALGDHLRQRRLLHRAPRPCLDRGHRPPPARLSPGG